MLRRAADVDRPVTPRRGNPCNPCFRYSPRKLHTGNRRFAWTQAVVIQTIQVMNQYHPINPHDHFARRTFDVVDHTRALLRTQLPPELLTKLRLDTLQHTRETFLSSGENEKRIDLLYSANFVDGTEVLIYFLLEHKSYVDRRIALQLLEYVLKIHDWRRRNNQPLCVVIPIVIYHGDKPWDEPTSLRHKIPASRQLSGFIPDMQAIVIDFSRQSPDIFSQTLRNWKPASAHCNSSVVRNSSSTPSSPSSDSCNSGGKSLRTKRL
ncbi:MAG UNVERIFIED_CONTAM: Rpn family recombination-promoting nuclease/putative transposase [Planctomycetaceae bacterium]